ncbi:hypothetical protein AQ505_19005 [Pedobacter sp. PACM 27299]|nr:hypothetical protein AQ505_19005 [Pedobacter sp. PACM 27299]
MIQHFLKLRLQSTILILHPKINLKPLFLTDGQRCFTLHQILFLVFLIILLFAGQRKAVK